MLVSFPGIELGTVGSHLSSKIYVLSWSDPSFWFGVWLRPDDESGFHAWDPQNQYMLVSYEYTTKENASEAILGISEGKYEQGVINITHVCRARIEPLDQDEVEILKKKWLPFLLGDRVAVVDEHDQKCPVVVGRWMESTDWCIS